MTVSVDGIRNFKVGNLMDYSGDWGIIFTNVDEDWISTDWTNKTIRSVRETIEKYANGADSYNVIPTFKNLDIDGGTFTEKEAKEFNSSLISPIRCMELFDNHSILEKAKQNEEEYYDQLLWLYEKWTNGYYVLLNY